MVENINTVDHFDRVFFHRSTWRTWPYRLALKVLPELFKPKSILDVGSAMGEGLNLCSGKWKDAKLTGLDFSPIGNAKARRRIPKADIRLVDFLYAESFLVSAELVLCCETLEHFEHPRVLERMLKKACSSGFISITVPYKSIVAKSHMVSFNSKWFVKRGYQTKVFKHPKQKAQRILVAWIEIEK